MAFALALLGRAAWLQKVQVLSFILLGMLCMQSAALRLFALAEDQLPCLACLFVSETTQLATRQAHPSHFHTTVQAFFSACAKMCVRELRKTDTANVSVFYLSFSSTVFAIIALTVSWLVGGAGVRIPSAPVDWGLFALVGEPVSEMGGCASRVVHRTDSTAPAVRHSFGSCLVQQLQVSCHRCRADGSAPAFMHPSALPCSCTPAWLQGGRICACIRTDSSAGLQGSMSEAVQPRVRGLSASEVWPSLFIALSHSECLAFALPRLC